MNSGYYLDTNWEWPLTVPLSKVKSCGVVPFFYIKMMKRRYLQACSLKHSIKKGIFSIMNLFRLGRGSPSPPSPRLRACNNLVPFHFWWMKIVLKRRKSLQYFVQDCSCEIRRKLRFFSIRYLTPILKNCNILIVN